MNNFERIFIIIFFDFIIIFNLGFVFDPFSKHFMFKAFPYYFTITIIMIFFYFIISLFFKKIHNYYLIFMIVFVLIKEYCALFFYAASIL